MWEKKKGNHQMWQKYVTCDVGTTQCDNGIVKCEIVRCKEKIKCEDGIIKCEKKNKGIAECDKSIVICDVSIIQCEKVSSNVMFW